MRVRFDISPEDKVRVEQIVERTAKLAEEVGIETINKTDLEMDLIATHANGCPMQFQRLLDADNFDFVHDVLGIREHLNRRTGRLEHHFLPRFAAL